MSESAGGSCGFRADLWRDSSANQWQAISESRRNQMAGGSSGHLGFRWWPCCEYEPQRSTGASEECGDRSLVGSNLGVRFGAKDNLVVAPDSGETLGGARADRRYEFPA